MIRNLMIGGASVEDALTLWASLFRAAKQPIRPLSTQDRVAISAGQFLDELLRNEPRKTGWMRAEAAGDQGPWRQQAWRFPRRPHDLPQLSNFLFSPRHRRGLSKFG
jgi:hypothetical protein